MAEARREIERAAELFAEAFRRPPLDAMSERVRTPYERASQALRRAQSTEGDPATLVALASSEVLLAALALSEYELELEPGAPPLIAERLFQSCAELLKAEGALDHPVDDGEPLPLDRLTLARTAALDASLDVRPADSSAILDEHQISLETFERVRMHWARDIEAATKRGKTAPLAEYDQAYVAQLEVERGPIDVDEYATLKLAAARGTQSEVLGELRLPVRAVMRVERVWLTRIVDNAELRRRLRAALDERR